MTIAPILRTVHVRRTPADAFRLFTEHLGAWWPLTSHTVNDGRSVGAAFVEGSILERTVDGDTVLWGSVRAWEPPHRLVFSWHPGRPDTEATEVEVRFTADEWGTRVELEHRDWDRLGDAAEARRNGYTGPSAWGYVLDHYCDAADRLDERPELIELRAAYATFHSTARAGNFTAPPDGEWSAAQVVAHVALTDDVMASVCRNLIARREAHFDNTAVQDVANLDRFVGGRSIDDVIADAERHSQDLLLLLGRLDDDQLATEVHCHLTDHGEVMVDGPMPWGRLALTVQTGRHLPSHTEQLVGLRTL